MFIVVFLLCAASVVHAQTIVHSEMVGHPTDKSITIQAFFDTDVDARINYGTDRDALTMSTMVQTFKAGDPVEFVVDGLTQNTRYYYALAYGAVGSKEFVSRPVRTFVTAPASLQHRNSVDAYRFFCCRKCQTKLLYIYIYIYMHYH